MCFSVAVCYSRNISRTVVTMYVRDLPVGQFHRDEFGKVYIVFQHRTVNFANEK